MWKNSFKEGFEMGKKSQEKEMLKPQPLKIANNTQGTLKGERELKQTKTKEK